MVTTKLLNIKINLKNFDPSLLNLDKKLSMYISIYYIKYITTKRVNDYENITSVNPLYLIINNIYGYIEESNGKKILNPCFYR